MDKEENLLKKRILELAEQCYQRDIPSHTDFLTLSEQTIFHSVSRELPPVRSILTGGYESAERKIVCFLPSYEEPETAAVPIRILQAGPAAPRFAEPLTHRDYLGALMNLGMERGTVGDIQMQETGCFIFCLENMADYIVEQFTMVRHTPVCCEDVTDKRGTGDGEGFSPDFEEIRGSVASPRLDSVVSMVFHLSRSKVLPYIVGEKVFIDGKLVCSPSAQLKGGEIVSVRGVGKFRFSGVEHETKKGRIFVAVQRYR